MTFWTWIGTAAITAGTTIAPISATTAAMAPATATTTAAIAFAAAAIITAASTARFALALAAAGALALGTWGITLLAITAVGATATTATAAATTAALITVTATFATLAVPFTVSSRGGFSCGRLYAEKTFEPTDETAAGFGFWSRGGQAITLLGPRIAARFTGFETGTVAPRAAVGIARTGRTRNRITGSRRRSIQRVKVRGRSGIGVARLAGAGLDAERRAILAAGSGFAGVRFPTRGGTFGFGGREDVELDFFGRDDGGRSGRRYWGDHRGDRSRGGDFDGSRGADRRDYWSYRLGRERILILAL